MSANESGTMRHVKGMASATYLYESERGNKYPRLDISIDYRSPKNIRLRTYDENHRVVDTLGANDLAEACLLAGLTIRSAETLHARKFRDDTQTTRSKRRPPVALRFLDALTLQLRRQGAAGAADVVRTAASLQFHPENWSSEREQVRVLALAEHTLKAWALPALKALGGEYEAMIAGQLTGYLADRPPFGPHQAADAGSLLGQTRLSDRPPGPNPVTPGAVTKVLGEVARSLLAVGQTAGVEAREAVSLPGDPLARSVEHAAMALAATFKAGVVTNLPPASGDVFALLGRIG